MFFFFFKLHRSGIIIELNSQLKIRESRLRFTPTNKNLLLLHSFETISLEELQDKKEKQLLQEDILQAKQ